MPGTVRPPPIDAEARCAACGYFLAGLASPGACPECGRAFDLSEPTTFIRHDVFRRGRYWLPGLIAAALVMAFGLWIGVFGFRSWGWSIWLATPMAGAVLAGYGTSVRSWLGWLLLIVFVGVAFLLMVISMNLGGVFCGLMLAGVVVVPITGAIGLGVALRKALRRSSFSQRWYLPVLLVSAALLICYALDGPPPRRPVETVTTQREVGVPAARAFAALQFYEEVHANPPWILRVGLARPLHVRRHPPAEGDVRTCVYNKGHITKRVDEVVAGRRLAFTVTDQQIGYERDVRLAGGSFEFEPVGPERCVVRLRTSYEGRLGPRFAWRWGEALAIRTLHNHVIDGIEIDARRAAEGP
ncbi:MAG TPA: hypothetical protein VD971_07870 [Phycisphaerales bacterium]|nr:hypothetical protein [Phycisphaerales bacterium]